MAKLNAAAVLPLCVVLAFLAGQSAAGRYYSDPVQNKVRTEVEKAIAYNPSVGPALVRLVFHDCWVNGCDGSVLLDKTPTDGTNTEKKAVQNIGLAGFEVIDTIKQKVGVATSCADILVFAGRDAADILSAGNIFYTLTGGRKDGVSSSASFADANLPAPTFGVDALKNNFAAPGHGFTTEELVVLSGAHSIGVAHLSSYQDRLGADATPIDPDFQAALIKVTPPDLLKKGQNPTVPNNARDASSAFRKDAAYDPVALGVNPKRGVLDNSYYHNNLVNKVLFESDWVLRTDGEAAGKLQEYRDNATAWNLDFIDAMKKLSGLRAQGKTLEIRKNCRLTNQQYYY
ncbi:Peroxidase 2 [Dichanthelium oligosanthes]|uniref:Peroxidase n=1 Tax=Dichanthelium oligosanthes TaxID=888268 RepID=A0A1E5WJ48_9POAL|nr:Peroxidase 2 [Dichanthelium oligosanthes]